MKSKISDKHNSPGSRKYAAGEAASKKSTAGSTYMADGSDQAAQQVKIAEAIDGSARMVAQRQMLQAIGAGSGDPGEPIQRAIDVSGGSFDTKNFAPYFWNQVTKATKHYGAKIILEFTPGAELGANGDHVSLVQSVKDEMQITKKKSTAQGFVTEETPAAASNKTAGFGLRTTDEGWAIDQQLYNDAGELVNLDPRYAEQRTDVNDPMKARPDGDLSNLESAGGDLKQGHVTSAEKGSDTWNTALLSDEPTVPIIGNKGIKGKQEFEVTAMHEGSGGDAYVGSVKWGWEVGDDGQPKIINLSKVSDGSASAAFKGAAGAWNAMDVPNKRTGATGTENVVKQLPT